MIGVNINPELIFNMTNKMIHSISKIITLKLIRYLKSLQLYKSKKINNRRTKINMIHIDISVEHEIVGADGTIAIF